MARIIDTAITVQLDTHAEAAADAPRYRVVRQRPMLVERVKQDAIGNFLPEHGFDCSANAGRR